MLPVLSCQFRDCGRARVRQLLNLQGLSRHPHYSKWLAVFETRKGNHEIHEIHESGFRCLVGDGRKEAQKAQRLVVKVFVFLAHFRGDQQIMNAPAIGEPIRIRFRSEMQEEGPSPESSAVK